jgi:hypothetical protein
MHHLFVDNNNYLTNSEYEKQSFVGKNTQSSSTTTTDSEKPARSALDAITIPINNHMKPTIVATEKRRKQIDRPFGESITSVDAYMKINNREKARKKKSTKENNPKTKKTKSNEG